MQISYSDFTVIDQMHVVICISLRNWASQTTTFTTLSTLTAHIFISVQYFYFFAQLVFENLNARNKDNRMQRARRRVHILTTKQQSREDLAIKRGLQFPTQTSTNPACWLGLASPISHTILKVLKQRGQWRLFLKQFIAGQEYIVFFYVYIPNTLFH